MKSIMKVILSGFCAVAILSCLCLFYSFVPLHHNNPDHTTDYVWDANSIWCRATEGFSWGYTDGRGFNNPQVIENPDVLILGSSHMEAMNVMQDKNTRAQLQSILSASGFNYSVYNRGISGHPFLKCCSFLRSNLKKDSTPPQYCCIETSDIAFTANEIQSLLGGTLPVTLSYSTGLLFYLQKIPFFRLLYWQMTGGLVNLFKGKTASFLSSGNTMQEVSADAYEQLFSYIASENEGRTKLIIFYHPTGKPQKDGTLQYDIDPLALHLFSEGCAQHGIAFIDMTDSFEKEWNKEHKTAHGFMTGSAFSGHLNATGHRLVAEALAQEILKEEASNVTL